MLEIDVKMSESYDETTQTFVSNEVVRVCLEHSLVSLSKWESVWKEPFLKNEEHGTDKTISYIRCMIVGEFPSEEVFVKLLQNHLKAIEDYVKSEMTATKISEIKKSGRRREIITSEVIYSWMVAMQIPFETQHWHLNRLLTLIRVVSIKNDPEKRKMTAAERQALNRQRRAMANSRG